MPRIQARGGGRWDTSSLIRLLRDKASGVLIAARLAVHASGRRLRSIAISKRDLRRLGEHQGRRAVLFLRQLDGALDLRAVEAAAGDPVLEVDAGEHLGSSGARSASASTTQSRHGCRAFLRIQTTSNAVQAAVPASTSSMGRGPRLRPPASGAPSTTIAWPLPVSATKLTPSIHLMRCFHWRSPGPMQSD